jgi:hypothetical protein
VDVPSELDIVQDGHLLEKLDILKGPGYAATDNLMGFELRDIPILKNNSPCVRMVEFRNAVYKARLAGPVRSDQRKQQPLLYFQADLVEGLDPPEMKGYILNFKNLSICIHNGLRTSEFADRAVDKNSCDGRLGKHKGCHNRTVIGSETQLSKIAAISEKTVLGRRGRNGSRKSAYGVSP